MGMSRCYSVMKCLLILINIIFLVVGAGVCTFCGWALVEGVADGADSRAGLAVLAAWAAALALAAVAALLGATRGSPGLLAGAFSLLALTAVAEGAAAWWGAAHAGELRVMLQERLAHTLARDYGRLPPTTHALDAIQQGLECCGVEGASDWRASQWSRLRAGAEAGEAGAAAPLDLTVLADASYYWVPGSCCAAECAAEAASGALRVAAARGAAGLHAAGCGARAWEALRAGARWPLAAAAALFAAHALALLLALALCLRAEPAARYKA